MTPASNDPLTTAKTLLAAREAEFCEYKEKTASLEKYASDCNIYAETVTAKLSDVETKLKKKTDEFVYAIIVAAIFAILAFFLLMALLFSKKPSQRSHVFRPSLHVAQKEPSKWAPQLTTIFLTQATGFPAVVFGLLCRSLASLTVRCYCTTFFVLLYPRFSA